MGKRDANDQQIENAAVMANAHSFISNLPNQYLTEVKLEEPKKISLPDNVISCQNSKFHLILIIQGD